VAVGLGGSSADCAGGTAKIHPHRLSLTTAIHGAVRKEMVAQGFWIAFGRLAGEEDSDDGVETS